MFNTVWILPDIEDQLWLHVVITCPPPPYVHSEMQSSVNSTHSDVTHRVVDNEFDKERFLFSIHDKPI